MTRDEFRRALIAAGYPVDRVRGSHLCTCRVTRAQVRELLGDKNWQPSGLSDRFDAETGLFHFLCPPPKGRQ